MKYCLYHPLEEAVWRNESATEHYCDRCVNHRQQASFDQALSFVGKQPLVRITSGQQRPPFWNIVPDLVSSPLHLPGVLCLLIWMATGFAVGMLQEQGWLLYTVLAASGLLLSVGGFSVMSVIAQGKPAEAMLANLSRLDGKALISFWLLHLVAVTAIVLAYQLGGAALTFVAFLLVCGVYPGVAIALLLGDEFSEAFAPRTLIELWGKLGGSYVVLAFWCLLLGLVPFVFVTVFQGELHPGLFWALTLGLGGYVLLVSSYTQGYLVNCEQHRLGFETAESRVLARRQKAIDPLEAQLSVLVKDGALQEVRKLLVKTVKSQPKEIRHHERLHQLLLYQNDEQGLFDHADTYLHRLSQVGDDARMYFVHRDLVSRRPDYLPDDPDIKVALAQQAFQRKQHEQIPVLLNRFHERYPNSLLIPEAYHLLAKALIALDKSEQAYAFLLFIKKKYPQYREIEEVESLLAQRRS